MYRILLKQKNNRKHKGNTHSLLFICLLVLLFSTGCKSNVNTNLLHDGKQRFVLSDYSLLDNGIKGILTELKRNAGQLPEYWNVVHFSASMSKDGIMNQFTLTLRGFDFAYAYHGNYSFVYDGKKKRLSCNGLNTAVVSEIEPEYNRNWDIDYLNSQFMRLPLKQQMEQMPLTAYELRFESETQLEDGMPLIDAREKSQVPVLTLDEYADGLAGQSDGRTGVHFLLCDAESMTNDRNIYYLCDPADTSTLYGHKETVMQYDYKLADNMLYFTNDWGETWIDSGLSEEEISQTMDFYKNPLIIPEDSYYVGNDATPTIAVLYGSEPKINLSKDMGRTWQKSDFPSGMQLPSRKRVIGFTSELEGYAALGSEYTLSLGEEKYLYLTHNGGLTWEEMQLPLFCSIHTLTGIRFIDDKRGIVSYVSSSDSAYPLLYATEDGGETWTILPVSWDEAKEHVSFLSKIDSLVFENDTYSLILGQDSSGIKAVFKSSSFNEEWIFQYYYKAVMHTAG